MRQTLLSPVHTARSFWIPFELVLGFAVMTVEILLVWRSLPGFAIFLVTYFSSPARQMLAWPKYDIINQISLINV